jgi:hypothetical protein
MGLIWAGTSDACQTWRLEDSNVSMNGSSRADKRWVLSHQENQY